jgi:hypothetical protein
MKNSTGKPRQCLSMAAIICFLLFHSVTQAQSAVNMVKLDGILDESTPGLTKPITMSGVASHLGNFTGVGEVMLLPGVEPGSQIGSGVAVLTAVNGDQLVGVVTWEAGAEQNGTREGSVRFAWRDSVTFSDGTVVSNTGRFVENRPPGLIIRTKIICIATFCFWFYD